MEYGLAPSDIAQIRKVFATDPQIKQVIIFGSRAMGTSKPGSDIDLVIIGDLSFKDMLDLDDKLSQLGLLYKFDLQNKSSIKDPDILAHISRVGKVFYLSGT